MTHFTQRERDKLEALKRAGHTQEDIADIIGCNQSTISRELKRSISLTQKRYTATIAQRKADERKKGGHSKLNHWYDNKELLYKILFELKDGKTPDQISGRRKYKNLPSVSHQTIYNYIAKDKEKGGDLYKTLRYQGNKYKWIGFDKNKTRILNRKDISERPKAVENKERYGDWESDLVISNKAGKGAVATFAERLSMYFQAIKVKSQSADEMVRASKEALGSLPKEMRKTMTHDNGKEICRHEEITEALKIEVYCARPYKSCDRGLNEWMNRELRRFFPKGTDFSKVKQKEIDHVVDWLNNCPRRSLNYRTPKEVFEEQLQIMRFKV